LGRGGPGGFAFMLKNSTIYMPLNTMWLKFRASAGTNNIPDPTLSTLNIRISSVEELEAALQQARNVMMSTHFAMEDFTFRTQENWDENIRSQVKNYRWSGGIIAAISLIVGGIGIMNIMFASITERIREIGVRKAVGATTFAIFIQILIESIVVSIIGGILGVFVSYGLVELLKILIPTDNEPVITLWAVVVSFCFSVLVGLMAGIQPAIKAAKLDPIEALRYD
jgi:putative ABC transport system permease protein